MYYELYIDVFFLENLMMDSLLLLALNHILKSGRTRGRIFLCAGLGSLLTCAAVTQRSTGIAKLFLFHVCINSVMLISGIENKEYTAVCESFYPALCSVSAPGRDHADLPPVHACGQSVLLHCLWILSSDHADMEVFLTFGRTAGKHPGGDLVYV